MRHPLALAVPIAAAFSLSLHSPLGAQAPMDDVLWVRDAANTQITAYDRFGDVVHRETAPVESIHRSPTGEIWTIAAGGGVLAVRARDGSAPRPTTDRPTVVAIDATGNAWSADAVDLEQWTPAPARTTRIALPAPATAICIDQGGRVWVGLATSPPRVFRRDPAAGTSATFGLLGARITRVAAMAAAFSPAGPSRIWLSGVGAGELIGLSGTGTVTDRAPIADDPNESLRQLAVLASGDVLLRGDRLYRFDPGSRGTTVLHASPTTSFGVDPLGRLWVTDANELISVDPRSGRADVIVAATGQLLDDAAGHQHAQAIAPRADDDGDGVTNRDELQIGTHPFDAQSNRDVHLGSPRVRYRQGQDLSIDVDASGGFGFVVLALGPIAPPTNVPGLRGSLLLAPSRFLAATGPLTLPTTLRLPVPDDAALRADLAVQAVAVGANPPPFLSNATLVRVIGRQPRSVDETFLNDVQLDKPVSAGTWTNQRATPGLLGGTGRLGSFDPSLGVEIAPNTWLWNTDTMTFPADRTLFGTVERVTDGRFEFTDLVLPAGTTVLFRGSHPAVLLVRGEVRVDGTLSLNGETADPLYDGRSRLDVDQITWIPNPGEPGTSGGAGGGAGGHGAESCDGAGTRAVFSGQPGDDLRAPATSGYAERIDGTGGRGGPLFPQDGLHGSVAFRVANFFCAQTAGGGGGGGFLAAGADGRVFSVASGAPPDVGPDGPGGIAVPFLPLPAGTTSLEHFLLGGSGGGGGGSQPQAMTVVEILQRNRPWHGGAAGSAGGGALALRIGRSFAAGPSGSLETRGGGGALYLDQPNQGPPSPGGSGSGGSILLQVDGPIAQSGTIDVRGGDASEMRFSLFIGGPVRSTGGTGSHGLVRGESSQPISAQTLGTVLGPPVVGPANVADLTEIDARTGFQSKWYPLSTGAPAEFDSYELRVEIGGVPVVFTDDPSNSNPADRPWLPVQLWLQGAALDPAGEPIGAPGPWRRYASPGLGQPSLNDDPATGVRFMVLFDRSIARDVVVRRFRVRYFE